MICKEIKSGFLYNYNFINDGLVELENPHMKDYPIYKTVKYEDWVDDYTVINKWDSL